MRYPFVCDSCGHEEEFWRSMSDGPPDSPSCSVCGEPLRRVYGYAYEGTKKCKGSYGNRQMKFPMVSLSDGVRSNQAQEKHYSRIIEDARKQAVQARRDTSRKGDGNWQLIGKVPWELHRAEQAESGRRVWDHDPVGTLKKHDLYFGE